MPLQSIIPLIAALFALVSLVQPLAAWARLPASVLLALAGILIGLGLRLTGLDAAGPAGAASAGLIIGSQAFLYIFLPTLLFETALTLDVRRVAEDAVPILVLAVVAVVLTTLAIGFTLGSISGQPLLVCLLLGAIVATTDPVAVVAIFRDIGAPARLGRLVEGESLLNDAAAITLFTIFLELVLSAQPFGVGRAVENFAWSFAGGAIVGAAGARLAAMMMGWMPRFRQAQVTLSLALPTLVFAVCEQALHVSGVIGVVVSGLVLSLVGTRRTAPDDWQYLKQVWEQLGFWASSLVFLFASLLIPGLLSSLGPGDLVNLAALIAAAFAARGAVLFGLMKILALLGLSPPVKRSFKLVILWGGLRGAVTLALALAVTENALLAPEVQRFVAVLATGFVLFTLLVQGITLRPLIGLLGLDQLSAQDRTLRAQVVALALADVRNAVAETARAYRISSASAEGLTAALDERIAASRDAEDAGLPRSERVTLALACLAGYEQQIVLERLEERTLSPRLAEALLIDARRLLDAARNGGQAGYERAARRALRFSGQLRLAQALHRRLGWNGPLRRVLAARFERLFASRIVLQGLPPFLHAKIEPIFGTEVARALAAPLRQREENTGHALEALRLQYPDYAQALEFRFLRRLALRLEELEYSTLFDEGLVGPELYRDLGRDLEAARLRSEAGPPLDLGLETRELMKGFPLFATLSAEQLEDVGRLLKPLFVTPGEMVIRRGERGHAVYFISSGAVEVDAAGTKIGLGRGDFFGELALLFDRPRNSDVVAIGYCRLLVLFAADFARFLSAHPEVRAQVEAIAEKRVGPGTPRPAERSRAEVE